jgi:hypothetical protein
LKPEIRDNLGVDALNALHCRHIVIVSLHNVLVHNGYNGSMFSNAIAKGYEEGLHLFVARLTTKSCHMNAQVYVTYDHKGLQYVNAMD